MKLSKSQKARLENIIKQAQLILREAVSETRQSTDRTSAKQRKKNPSKAPGRRSREDAAVMRGEIQAARKKGARVTELAEKFGVTPSYIYQMR